LREQVHSKFSVAENLDGCARNQVYNALMESYRVTNGVPSPEEMGRKLGLSKKRVASVRVIMGSPTTKRTSKRSVSKSWIATRSKSTTAKRSTARKSGRG
jgi:hypothetical protein